MTAKPNMHWRTSNMVFWWIWCLWVHFGLPSSPLTINRTLPDDTQAEYFIEDLFHTLLSYVPNVDRKWRASFGQSNFLKLPDYFRLTDSGSLWTQRVIDRDSVTFCSELKCCPLQVCEIKFTVVFTPTENAAREPRLLDVVLQVLDQNDNAPIFPRRHYVVKFKEEVGPGEQIVLLPAAQDTDSHQFGVAEYELVDPSDTFKLATRQGRPSLQSIRRLDFENEKDRVFQMQVVAKDRANPLLSGVLNVTVLVEDINDHRPQVANEQVTLNLKENTTYDGPVTRIQAMDKDSGENGKLKFTLTSLWDSQESQDALKKFHVDSSNGDVYIKSPLDYEKYSERDLQMSVVVSDHGLPSPLSTTVRLLVNLSDVNDNACYFDVLQNETITENHPGGELVLRLMLRDEDSVSQDRVFCSLVPTASTQGLLRLVNTTQTTLFLYTNTSLDYETSRGVYAILRCVDLGEPVQTVQHSFYVAFADENDHQPIFVKPEYVLTVMESTTIGTVVGQVLALDADDVRHFGLVRYHLMMKEAPVELNTVTGELVLTQTLDYETVTFYHLEVAAVDAGGLSGVTLVRIVLEDNNDNAPIFALSQQSLSISESTAVGTELTRIRAYDKDTDDNGLVKLRFPEKDGLRSYQTFFNLQPSGELILKSQIDREVTPNFTLVIEAYDGGKPSLSSHLTLIVKVEDVNDWTPIVTKPKADSIVPCPRRIPDSPPYDVRLLVLQAEDLDLGMNAELTFRLQASNGSGFFRVNSSTGEFFTGWQFQAEAPVEGVYEILLLVTDSGYPVLSSHSRFFVNVTSSLDAFHDSSRIEASQGLAYHQFRLSLSLNNLVILVIIVLFSVSIATGLIAAILWVKNRTNLPAASSLTHLDTFLSDVTSKSSGGLMSTSLHLPSEETLLSTKDFHAFAMLQVAEPPGYPNYPAEAYLLSGSIPRHGPVYSSTSNMFPCSNSMTCSRFSGLSNPILGPTREPCQVLTYCPHELGKMQYYSGDLKAHIARSASFGVSHPMNDCKSVGNDGQSLDRLPHLRESDIVCCETAIVDTDLPQS